MDYWPFQQSYQDADSHDYNGHAYDPTPTRMERTSSESTDCTYSSEQTALSDSSDITQYDEESVYGYSYCDLGGAAVSQQAGIEQCDTIATPADPPFEHYPSVIDDVESTAWSASEYAKRQLQWGYKPAEMFIKVKEIRRRARDLGPEAAREAVQQIVLEGLRKIFRDEANPSEYAMGILQEAAHYIQWYAGGLDSPAAFEICRVAIVCTLTELQQEALQARTSFRLQQPAQYSPDKSKSTCHEPECKGKSFGRVADLQRHYENVHLPVSKRKQFICDYRKCPRHKSAFNRADHFRDHLRDYHREDLVQRSRKPDSSFWETRSGHALFQGWWRCNRLGCFKRVDTETNGFTCTCGQPCELERQNYRSSSQFQYEQEQYLAGKDSA